MGHDVEVVFHAINAIQVALFVFQGAPVFEQFGAILFGNYAFPVLRAEDDLMQDLRI